MPNSYPALKIWKGFFGVNSKKKEFTKAEISINISRLEKQELVRKEPKRKIILTEKGKELISYIEFHFK
ncbi:MAG: hypothetical protein QMC93_01490 [Patescibacteria group bacterium]|nr:hypothetical protein [Patescibacteria group bacterium]